ncbi:Phox/Bem1p [Corchorus capsularis]|uniref:Phox/Bem1p n=1 Tax=Corchorus capsularis TaxID=210143 RepID=A0A1R3J9J2_COCAP|nr:Phox/Bem1p [Corchorus capsularis]
MCNKGIVDHQQQQSNQAVYLMDSPSSTLASALASTPSSNDETPRVKFLCSFLGSILPRPQDGKLRYVGGETRIVSVPRDISYEELMSKMRELYDGAAVLKYQQPDEDLDALVSVVNDDDVINMMEEYEKLGTGDGFTRLRIFLFSHPEQDGSLHYVDGDERETERRYVDALNSLNEGSDFRKCDSPVIAPVSDDIHFAAEQFFNSMSIDGGLHSRSGEMSMPPYNLHHLTIPHMGSGQLQQSVPQRYNEIEGPWSPAYYSPRHHGHHEPRVLSEFPPSPSSGRYRVPFPELSDKCVDRMPEEYVRQQLNHHLQYDHQPQLSDNVVWMPTGAIPSDKAGGFPGNLLHGHGVFEGNHICEHCRATFSRNQPPHLEHPSMGNGVPSVNNLCAECPPNREAFLLNADGKLHPGFYSKDHTDPRSAYSETNSHERGWVLQHQLNPRAEEARNHLTGGGRLNDHYVVDGPGTNLPIGHASLADGHHLPSNYVHHRAGPELGNDVFHDQAVVASSHLQIPPEERGVRYGNYPYPYGADNVYPGSHGHAHTQSLWRNVQNPIHGTPPYEASGLPQQVNGTANSVFLKGPVEGSARLCVGIDNQSSWVESPQKMPGFDGTAVPDSVYAHPLNMNVGPHGQDVQHSVTAEPVQSPQDMLNFAPSTEAVQASDQSSNLIDDKSVSDNNPKSRDNSNSIEALMIKEKIVAIEDKEANHVAKMEKTDVPSMCCPEQNKNTGKESKTPSLESSNPDCLKLAEKCAEQSKPGEKDPSAAENSKLSANRLSFIPQFVASVKKAALEEVEEVKAKVEDDNTVKHDAIEKEVNANESESVNAHGEVELDSDNDNISPSKIEPTKAEEEAIARGLQTIRNDDLEEIRELGSGTYGAVFHGKWKGSDVAIKRIKASCFAGRPSERERLIADFWKEALILSSLHHPNVVSFYGIVRDGPDGSLATVTEFMVNGSLKQFLQKKDRTIDRRKRLIIAMDAAFGMEYLHGKNIVHFDLKCENLLVNMRDPQRPVCKIGDLGLSKVRQHTLVSGGVRGTLPWMAPELLSGKSNMVTEKIDVYSFGIVMWELLTGEEPYADMHCASIIGGIVNNTLRPKIPSWCDPEWKGLMEKCWASDPAERPSFSEISQKLRNMAAAINVK